MLGAGIFAYLVAVAHRTSFGVAGLTAADQFGVGATTLSLFVVVQVVMYTVLQLPVGLAVDRWGSRRTLAVGAGLAAAGQLGMVLADDVPTALVARMLIGSGDAATFVSVLRLIPAWFPVRRVPLLSQTVGSLGQLGQVVSAVPFAWALHTYGWAPAFAGLAGLGVVATVTTWTGVRDRPPGAPRPTTHRSPFAGLGRTARSPGTWLGFFAHGLGGTGVTAFTLMWGFPFSSRVKDSANSGPQPCSPSAW